MSDTMRAIAVSKRGGVETLSSQDMERPRKAEGHDILVEVKAVSINPIDIKVRSGIYDDYPDYFDHVPKPLQILGYDGAGVVSQVGPEASEFSQGDEVYYAGSPIRHGSNAEYQLVDSRAVAKKPESLTFIQAASMPLTYITAYEALVERMEIRRGEKAALLIVNGAGGVGSIATQIARKVLSLPVVITTTSRPETTEFSRKMGATHTVNHHKDIVPQVKQLELPPDIPLKYIFITHSTTPYLAPSAALCAPFGRVCSIVQTKEMDKMYGTEFMAKSLSFHWCLLGTKPYYKVDMDSHGRMLKELASWIDKGKIECHMTRELPLTLKGLQEAHADVESGKRIGKVACGIELDDSAGVAFT